MARGTRITDEQKAHVIRLARNGEGRNAIVKATGIAAGTITKIVHDAGLSFDRAATEQATASRKADLAARRAELEGKLLDDAERLRALIWSPMEYRELGNYKSGENSTPEWVTYVQTTPTVQDQERLMRAVSTAVRTSQAIADAAGDGDTDQAKSMLVQLMALLGQQWVEMQASDD